MPRAPEVLVSCEHGGNHVPEAYRALFAGVEERLGGHESYDAGALVLARALSGELDAPLIASEVTRLLIDLNRSRGRKGLYSAVTRKLPPGERRRILEAYYLPHRAAVAGVVAANRARGAATLHVAAHTFTPVLGGVARRMDAGLLYDPARPGEAALCARWREILRERAPALAVRRNAPYKGASDGLAAWLRRQHPETAYLGVELELNQKLLADARAWADLCALAARSLREAIGQDRGFRPGAD